MMMMINDLTKLNRNLHNYFNFVANLFLLNLWRLKQPDYLRDKRHFLKPYTTPYTHTNTHTQENLKMMKLYTRMEEDFLIFNIYKMEKMNP